MFDCDTVFARHEKFNRSALARLVTWDHLRGSTWQRGTLAKLLAKAKIAEKDVLSKYLLVDRHWQHRLRAN
jgi:hypothetical protein